MKQYDVIIVGGGAAGFFTAINLAEQRPKLSIAIVERGAEVLSKVRISGGGRCNVTHACFIPNELVGFYPRGEKELKGPFNRFCTGDTVAWFEKRGVALKTEDDGRMFPESNSSQSIIDCFIGLSQKYKIAILTGHSVKSIFKSENNWKVETQQTAFACENLVMTTGSNPKIWELLKTHGHNIISPVPSLFTFNIKDNRIKDLMGISSEATVKVKNSSLEASGPLLITHWGMSGPGILRLSAWGARELYDKKYQFQIDVNWLPNLTSESVFDALKENRSENPKKTISTHSVFFLPSRLWEKLVLASLIEKDVKWADVTNKQLQNLTQQLTACTFQVNGKSTFKEEFVTAGGVDLKEVNFKTMESKLVPNLYFAGEVLNIDAITGGFNFQNAWTGGFIIAEAICAKKVS